jgi:hypothetical protein
MGWKEGTPSLEAFCLGEWKHTVLSQMMFYEIF